MPLNELQLRDLTAQLRNSSSNALDARAASYERLQRIASGDFWGVGGEDWRGRRPRAGTAIDEVKKLFVADDRVNSAINRFISATLGRDPEWMLTDTTSSATTASAELQGVSAALSAWHKDAGLHNALKAFARHTAVYGSSSLKVYIPDAYLELAARGSAATLADALELIHIIALTPLQSGALIDAHDRTLAHWQLYAVTIDGVSVQHLEVHTPEDVSVYALINLAPVSVVSSVPNPLYDPLKKRRAHFMMRHAQREQGSMLTSSVLDKQDALNESWTNLKRNDQLAGFRSVITTNAAPPTNPITGAPIEWTFGPSLVIELQGRVTAGTAAAPEGIATPNVIIVDPVDPRASSIPTIEQLKASLLEEFDQLWTQLAGGISGESKRESRKAFDKRVIEDAGELIETLRWALRTTLSLAAWLEGQPGKYAPLEIAPKLFLDVERANIEVFKVLIPAYAAGIVSLETMVSANPAVEDADAELARLAPQPAALPTQSEPP